MPEPSCVARTDGLALQPCPLPFKGHHYILRLQSPGHHCYQAASYNLQAVAQAACHLPPEPGPDLSA